VRTLFNGEVEITFGRAIINLMGHIAGAAVLFVVFFSIGWAISFFIHWLDSIHKLPEEMANFMARFELWLVYIDAGLCAVVVSVGGFRFIKDLGKLK